MIIFTFGIALWVGAWPMFLLPIATFATLNWIHIPFEETKMRNQFGGTFDAYVPKSGDRSDKTDQYANDILL